MRSLSGPSSGSAHEEGNLHLVQPATGTKVAVSREEILEKPNAKLLRKGKEPAGGRGGGRHYRTPAAVTHGALNRVGPVT